MDWKRRNSELLHGIQYRMTARKEVGKGEASRDGRGDLSKSEPSLTLSAFFLLRPECSLHMSQGRLCSSGPLNLILQKSNPHLLQRKHKINIQIGEKES